MKAQLFKSKREPLQQVDVATPQPSRGQILVRLHYAALNHQDLWIWKELQPEPPVVLGSDGSGVVEAVGKGVHEQWIGKEVVINPAVNWGDNEKVPGEDFEILGYPNNGTFSQYIAVPSEYVFEKPAHLGLKEAAALPLAALTAYRSLFTKARLSASDKVLITGIGGGVALFLLQMAKAITPEIYVTSSSQEKLQEAMRLGAKGGFNYKEHNWAQQAKALAGGFDVIIDSAGGDGFATLTEVANPAARMVVIGRTNGNINNLSPRTIFNKQLQIMGTLMGTITEFRAMLELYSRHRLRPVIDREFELKDLNEAMGYMASGKHFGKIMLKIS